MTQTFTAGQRLRAVFSGMQKPAIIALAFLVAASSPLVGQVAGAEARLERLADGVYAIIHPDATTDWSTNTTDWPHSNVGVVIGDKGVLVVDSDYLPSRAIADIAVIRSLTTKPVLYLVNTHWHGDHTHGNAAYRGSFPGIAIVGARETREHIEIMQARFPALMTTSSARAQQIRDLEQLLARGQDSAGGTLSSSEKARLALNIRQRRGEIEELSKLRVAPPTMVFDNELPIDLGNRLVLLHNWGRAHSPDDVTIYLPREQILFSGDILVHPVPYAWHSYPTHWRQVLRGIEALPVAALVPGHGPVQHDHTYTRLVYELMDSTIARTSALVRRGGTVDSVKKQLDLSDLRPRFVQPNDSLARVLWDGSIKDGLAERAYWCVIGYDC
jgi:cyclase